MMSFWRIIIIIWIMMMMMFTFFIFYIRIYIIGWCFIGYITWIWMMIWLLRITGCSRWCCFMSRTWRISTTKKYQRIYLVKRERNETCVDWIHYYYYHWMMNDVYVFFDQMIVVDYVYAFFLLLMNDDVYPNLFLLMKIQMKSIQERIVDDENMIDHVNLFDVDYYVYSNENLLKTTWKFYLNKSSYDTISKCKIYNLYK